MSRTESLPPSSPRRRFAKRILAFLHVLLVLMAVGLFGFTAIVFVRESAAPKPESVSVTMEAVDWHSPDSSVYCLSCHRNVGRAAAGLDVEHGHPLNVALSAAQLDALTQLGTIAGPGDTLICMSCHKLDSPYPHMLAAALIDGALCEHCHRGHYARGTPHDLRQSAPNERNRLGETVAEGGPCSACHLSHRYARDFVSTELDPDGRCITCHQDYRVAASHARHRIEHPKSRCLECHNPHDVASGEFLKKPEPDLCLECHKSYNAGLAAGMHPIGAMNRPVPEALLHAGARTGADLQTITCTTCHAVHEAGHESLLILARNTNQLCLACHQDKLIAGNDGTMPRHGQSPVLDRRQQEVVAEWNRPLGANQELLCVSCHRMHAAEQSDDLLAFQPRQSDACIACHPTTAVVAGSVHDLSVNFPQARNRAGQSVLSAGVCSSCHTAHRFARDPVPGPGDPSGQCMACHLAGRVGDTKVVGNVAHPKTRCGECHNPHAPEHGNFLAKPEAQLCGSCHETQMQLRGGPHDFTPEGPAGATPRPASATRGLCLPCHVPHGGSRQDLFRVAEGDSLGNHDEVCLACHAAAGWGASGPITAIHPQRISSDQKKVELALVPTDDAGNLRMGCRTCHNPHGGADRPYLARVEPNQPTQALCVHCHTDKDYIKYTGHSAEKLAAHDFDVDSCKPCHAMHADPRSAWGQMLSPRFLTAKSESPEAALQAMPCGQCHSASGHGPARMDIVHPPIVAVNMFGPEDPGFMPLFNADGRIDPQGQVTCRTCHVSHGRIDLLKRAAEARDLTDVERAALKAHVRPFVATNTCTVCHGEIARLLFLYFHEPGRRPAVRPGG